MPEDCRNAQDEQTAESPTGESHSIFGTIVLPNRGLECATCLPHSLGGNRPRSIRQCNGNMASRRPSNLLQPFGNVGYTALPPSERDWI